MKTLPSATRLLLAVFAWLACGLAVAGIRERLQLPPVLRGAFAQTRHLQGFQHPLASRGTFVLARGRGVLWQVRQPFASTTVIARNEVFTLRPDGQREVVLDKSQSQAVAMLDTLLPALLGGDLDRLAKLFVASESTVANGDWRVELRPKSPALAKVFVRIVLQGDAHVRQVRLEEQGGDATDIDFSALRDTPATLDAAEAKAFE